jgi:hypothetical protein
VVLSVLLQLLGGLECSYFACSSDRIHISSFAFSRLVKESLSPH